MQTSDLRKLMKPPLSSALTLSAGLLLAGASRPQVTTTPPGAASQSQLAKEAAGILQQNCASCHSGASPTGGLRLTGRAEMLKGGASGPAVSLAKPDDSLLLKAVRYQG